MLNRQSLHTFFKLYYTKFKSLQSAVPEEKWAQDFMTDRLTDRQTESTKTMSPLRWEKHKDNDAALFLQYVFIVEHTHLYITFKFICLLEHNI
jgi:hypothetical protein